MEEKDVFVICGTLAKDAEPVLSREKEAGCLLAVECGGKIRRVEIFSPLSNILYKKALKGTRVLIPVRKSSRGTLSAAVAYPV